MCYGTAEVYPIQLSCGIYLSRMLFAFDTGSHHVSLVAWDLYASTEWDENQIKVPHKVNVKLKHWIWFSSCPIWFVTRIVGRINFVNQGTTVIKIWFSCTNETRNNHGFIFSQGKAVQREAVLRWNESPMGHWILSSHLSALPSSMLGFHLMVIEIPAILTAF